MGSAEEGQKSGMERHSVLLLVAPMQISVHWHLQYTDFVKQLAHFQLNSWKLYTEIYNLLQWAPVSSPALKGLAYMEYNMNKKGHSVPAAEVASMKWFGCGGSHSSVCLYCLASPPSLEAAQLMLGSSIGWHAKMRTWFMLKVSGTLNQSQIKAYNVIHLNIQRRQNATCCTVKHWAATKVCGCMKDCNTHHRINRMLLYRWRTDTSSKTGMAWITCIILDQRGREVKDNNLFINMYTNCNTASY